MRINLALVRELVIRKLQIIDNDIALQFEAAIETILTDIEFRIYRRLLSKVESYELEVGRSPSEIQIHRWCSDMHTFWDTSKQ